MTAGSAMILNSQRLVPFPPFQNDGALREGAGQFFAVPGDQKVESAIVPEEDLTELLHQVRDPFSGQSRDVEGPAFRGLVPAEEVLPLGLRQEVDLVEDLEDRNVGDADLGQDGLYGMRLFPGMGAGRVDDMADGIRSRTSSSVAWKEVTSSTGSFLMNPTVSERKK